MDILKYIDKSVKKVSPDAEVFLFGSRARNNNIKNSDWDILILLPENSTYQIRTSILNELLEIELSENQMFNVIFKFRDNWYNNKLTKITPFYQSVTQDYVRI